MTDDELAGMVQFFEQFQERLRWACARLSALSCLLIHEEVFDQKQLDDFHAFCLAELDRKDASAGHVEIGVDDQ